MGIKPHPKNKPAKAGSPQQSEVKIAQETRLRELTEALQRERADAENLRRRHQQQLEQLEGIIKANLVRGLLPVLDNFERSLRHAPNNSQNDAFVQGVNGIVKQFEAWLAQLGIERIKTVGQIFDPAVHEAVAVEEVKSYDARKNNLKEIVSQELQSGYRLGNEVIRHASVKVKVG